MFVMFISAVHWHCLAVTSLGSENEIDWWQLGLHFGNLMKGAAMALTGMAFLSFPRRRHDSCDHFRQPRSIISDALSVRIISASALCHQQSLFCWVLYFVCSLASAPNAIKLNPISGNTISDAQDCNTAISIVENVYLYSQSEWLFCNLQQHANAQQCTAAEFLPLLFLFSQSGIFKHKMLIRGNQRSETWHGLPSQTAHNCLEFHCIGRHPSDRDASDTLCLISSKTAASQGETKQVLKCTASCSGPLWNSASSDSKDGIFYSEPRRRIISLPCEECHTVPEPSSYIDQSLVFPTQNILNLIFSTVVELILIKTSCPLLHTNCHKQILHYNSDYPHFLFTFVIFSSKFKLHHLLNTAISRAKKSPSGTAVSHISALVVLAILRSKSPQLQ